MNRWRKGAVLVSSLVFCAVAAKADTVDSALDTVLGNLNAGDVAGALASLDRVDQTAGPAPAQLIRARYYRAYAYKRKGDYASSITEFQKLLPLTAAAAQRDAFKVTGGVYAAKAELVFSETLFEAGRFDEAAQAYGQFAADFPTHERAEDAAFRKEESLRRAGRYQDAYDYVTAMPKVDADWEIKAAVRQGELLTEYLRKPNTGIQAVRDIIAKYPDHPTNVLARHWLAETLFGADRFAEAADAYGDFATRYPADPWARFAALRKEESLRDAGQYQAAYGYLLSLPTPDPEMEIQTTVRRSALLAQFMRKDFALSNQLLTDIIAKYPDHPTIKDARCRLARNYLYDLPAEQRDSRKAREIEQQLVAANPDWNMQFELRLDIANSYYFEKDYASAIPRYQALLYGYTDNYPKDNWHAHVRYLLGDAQYGAKDRKAAFATWKDVVALYPNDDWAKLAQQRLAEAGVKL